MTATVDTVPLSVLADRWLNALEASGKSPATVKFYGTGLRGFIAWHAQQGTEPVLDADTLNRYLVALRRAGQQPGTLRLRYATLKVFAAWTGDGDLSGVKPPRGRQREVDALSDAEVAALLHACQGDSFTDRRDYALLKLLLSTGLRAWEAVALTLADIDKQRQVLYVRHGKGDKARTVPLLPDTGRVIDRSPDTVHAITMRQL